MDLGQLVRACDFSIALSMGEIHVRSLTSPWLAQLERIAKSDAADDEVPRLAMRLAARTFPRPADEKWDDPDDPGSGEEIAAAATPQDLEAFARKLMNANGWLIRTTTGNENEPVRGEAESAIVFLRRCLVWHTDKFTKIRQNLFGQGAGASMERMTRLNDSVRYQLDQARRVRDAVDSVPRLEDRLGGMAAAIDTQFTGLQAILQNLEGASVKAVNELEQSSRSSAKFNKTAITIAAVSVLVTAIISGFSLVRDVYDFKVSPASKGEPAVSEVVRELKAMKEELRAIRAEASARAAARAPPEVLGPTNAPASTPVIRNPAPATNP